MNKFKKIKKSNFLENGSAHLIMAKIYDIEGTKEVLQNIQEPIPLIRRGQRNVL